VANKSKRKGYAGEVELVQVLTKLGFEAERDGRPYSKDVRVKLAISDVALNIEVKRRRDAWNRLYGWIEGNDMLALRADYRDWLLVMKPDVLCALLRDLLEKEK